ncbi:cobalt-precorrin-6A reductase [Lichenifustis flavocetrariae]|uniref:Cobalt-precorrin-6A reductase n=1 Tax=Lichenifustis flavocetrariae TaxID=2949735 RepID=A0AA41Z542_9HYPH|nr:cobalt-precorrin-6A reductase [Lichenifustis flavocetrariae]MCW6510643.1 cobalt-precorrin-6A reductase [Lichenifustis flavocetrariae]
MRVLILGGSTEASRLAWALAGHSTIYAILSLAGRTAEPALAPIPTRVGGFGGVEGLAAYLDRERIAAVVDATHPFAARMSAHAVAACKLRDVPLAAFSRPPWRPGPADRWILVADIPAAVQHLAALAPGDVFLTTGRLDLQAFSAAPLHRYLIRTIDPPPTEDCPPVAQIMLSRGPFPLADEIALMRNHGVTLLVTKNSGGDASAAKLEAARRLSVPVLMVERPSLPARLELDTLDAVLAWIETHRALP